MNLKDFLITLVPYLIFMFFAIYGAVNYNLPTAWVATMFFFSFFWVLIMDLNRRIKKLEVKE